MSSSLNPNAEPFYMTAAHTRLEPYYLFTYCLPPPIPLQTPAPATRGFNGKKRVSPPTTRRKKGVCTSTMRSKQQLLLDEQESQLAVPKRVPKQKKGLRRDGDTRMTPFKVISFPTDLHQQEISAITTVMIKNVPNHFKRVDIIDFLCNHCRDENLKAVLQADPSKSEFDFVYLPMDFTQYWNRKRITNLGYAFVNFTTAVAAVRFFKTFHCQHWGIDKNNKLREITVAKVQGVKALVKHFMAKKFWCHTDEYLPAVSDPPCDGVRMPKLVTVGQRVGMPFWGLKKKVNTTYVFRV